MNLVSSFYREEILEHYRSPLNFGKISNADVHARQTNPLCGDDITIWIKFDSDEKSAGVNGRHLRGVNGSFVKEIKFQGKGCAICLAAASILTDYVKNKSKKELTKLGEQDMLKLLGIEVSQTRKKCALLALMVLKECLQ